MSEEEKREREERGKKGRRLRKRKEREIPTHSSIFSKQHVHGHIHTEVEDVDVVLDSHLELSEGRHLHDWTSGVDGEEGGGCGVGHQRRVDSQGGPRSQAKTGWWWCVCVCVCVGGGGGGEGKREKERVNS